MCLLKVEHVQKYYGNGGNITKALNDISFDMKEGEFVAIMGASGSGKTTLLNVISTIDTLSAVSYTHLIFRCSLLVTKHLGYSCFVISLQLPLLSFMQSFIKSKNISCN